MDQAVFVRRRQALRRLPADPQHLRQRQPALALQPGVQALALQQRHGQERHALLLADLVDGHDVVVGDRGGQLRLAQEAPPRSGAGRQGRLHRLQGDVPPQPGVFGQEDDAHAARPQHLQHAVVAQPAHLVRLPRRRQQGTHVLRVQVGGPRGAGAGRLRHGARPGEVRGGGRGFTVCGGRRLAGRRRQALQQAAQVAGEAVEHRVLRRRPVGLGAEGGDEGVLRPDGRQRLLTGGARFQVRLHRGRGRVRRAAQEEVPQRVGVKTGGGRVHGGLHRIGGGETRGLRPPFRDT